MNIDTIKAEWQAMLYRGTIPCFEYQISADAWLLVDLEFTNEGLKFSFDSYNNRVALFDGVITVIDENFYMLPWDLDMSLDSHLDIIIQNMVEGYLLVNGLYYCED